MKKNKVHKKRTMAQRRLKNTAEATRFVSETANEKNTILKNYYDKKLELYGRSVVA